MLIRSQNKTNIVNVDNVTIIGGVHEIMADAFILGNYSTEEKAIKVLDMIQDAYARCESIKVLTSGIAEDLATKIKSEEKVEEYRNVHREKFVFQMPQDSEV